MSTIDNIQYPFSTNETLSFDEYVKHFTSAFTRMNDFTLYSKDEYHDGVYDILAKQVSRNKFKVAECPTRSIFFTSTSEAPFHLMTIVTPRLLRLVSDEHV